MRVSRADGVEKRAVAAADVDEGFRVRNVGDQPKKMGVSNDGKPLTYVPWDSGTYWVTACREDYCFIVLSVAHTI